MAAIRLAETDSDIARCFDVMHQLRPKLMREQFVSIIRTQQGEGYQLAFLEEEDRVVSAAGFRMQQVLVSGKTLYVDDLVTDEHSRSKGHGEAMLQWLIERARSSGCNTFSLDSGSHRFAAHAFYFRHRLRITSFHFELPL